MYQIELKWLSHVSETWFDIEEVHNRHAVYCVMSVWPQVGVKIDASSFSLTRIVTFVPFYMLVNRTKHCVYICEEGQDNWTEAEPEQVRAKFSIIFTLHLCFFCLFLYCH